MIDSLLLLACLLPGAYAYTTFDTNCTLPSGPDKINYISSPNTRGTLDILWSCLFTIIACTWTVQYSDLPTQRNQFAAGRRGWWKWTVTKYSDQGRLFLLTIFAPEVLLGAYIRENIRIRAYFKEVEDSGYPKVDRVEWTTSHAYFAEMDGFVMKICKQNPNSSDRSTQTQTQTQTVVATTENSNGAAPDQSPDTAKGQDEVLYYPDSLIEEGDVAQEDTESRSWTIGCSEILALRKAGMMTRLPDISAEEIHDRSKADGFVRVITVFQILWLCMQTIARAVEGLVVTHLEIATVAFAICAVFMYVLCWDKPKGVQVPITVFQYYGDAQRIFDELRAIDAETSPTVSRNWIKRTMRVSPESFAGLMAALLGGMTFGGIHLIAWNFSFPTHVELILWRVSALLCTCFLPAGLLGWIIGIISEGAFEARGARLKSIISHVFEIVIIYVLGGLYVLARLFIIVEMFRTLAFQPTEAYVGTWTVNIPYVG